MFSMPRNTIPRLILGYRVRSSHKKLFLGSWVQNFLSRHLIKISKFCKNHLVQREKYILKMYSTKFAIRKSTELQLLEVIYKYRGKYLSRAIDPSISTVDYYKKLYICFRGQGSRFRGPFSANLLLSDPKSHFQVLGCRFRP